MSTDGSTRPRRTLALLAALSVTLLLSLCAPGGASARPPSMGDPVPSPPQLDVVPGSFEREPLLVPDPQGGPPWTLGTFLYSDAEFSAEGVCTVVGRFWHGKVGRLDVHNVFHPYEPGAGANGCSGSAPGQERGPLWGAAYRNALEPDAPCYPFPDPPDYPGVPPACDQADLRSFQLGIWGTGLLSAQALVDGGWRPVPTTHRGGYLFMLPGTADGQLETRMKFRFANCGPFARPELARLWGATVDGCVITFEFSTGEI